MSVEGHKPAGRAIRPDKADSASADWSVPTSSRAANSDPWPPVAASDDPSFDASGETDARDHLDSAELNPIDHPALRSLEKLLVKGRLLEARLGYQRLADAIEQSPDGHGPTGEAIWLEAARNEFECGLRVKQHGEALTRIGERFQRFDGKEWELIRNATNDHYQQMISLSVSVGLDEQALEIFEQAREHVRLTPKLRQKLLEVSIRLGRADPGTARLCIDEAFARDLEQEKLDELMSVIRRAIRVDLVTPADELLTEFVELNERVREQTDLRWPVAHLAIAGCRQKRLQEVLDLSGVAGTPLGTDADTSCLIGTAFYLNRKFTEAGRWFKFADSQNDAQHGLLAGFLLDLYQLNRLIETGGSGLADRDSVRRVLMSRLAGLTERNVPKHWRLDALWLAGCANIFLGNPDQALETIEDLPVAFAAWTTASCFYDTLRTRRCPDEADVWAGRLRGEQPVLHQLLSIRQALRDFRFEIAASLLNEFRVRTPEGNAADVQSAAKCLKIEFELTLPDLVEAIEAASQTEATSDQSVRPAAEEEYCRDWMERLAVRRLIENFELDAAEHRLNNAKWFTTPDIECARLKALLLFAREPDSATAGKHFSAIISSPDVLPVDQLHNTLWRSRLNPKEAQPELEEMRNRWPDCLEISLAVIRGRLLSEQPDVSLVADLERICTLSNWQNHGSYAWMRPWMDLAPRGKAVSRALVTSSRLADMLQAADLQRQCGLLDASVRTLGHIETLAGEDVSALRAPVSARFTLAAEMSLEQANWKKACVWHEEAVRRGAEHGDFAERLALAFADADAVPAPVMAVLFGWLARFDGSEELFLATTTGQTVRHLTHITSEFPENLAELKDRRERNEKFSELRPDWDLPKRGRAFAAGRDGNDELVVELVGLIQKRSQTEEGLLGHALWNLRRFAEAERAFFRAADATGWTGCARAAARMVALESNGQWIGTEEADEILEILDPRNLDPQQAMRVEEWRIAVQLGARRGPEVMESLERLGNASWLDSEQMRALVPLALLMAGRTEDACLQLCPAELWEGELPHDRRGGHLRGLGLFLLTRLAWPARRDLPRLWQMLVHLRKLNEASPAFVLAEAQFAVLQGDASTAGHHLQRLTAAHDGATAVDGVWGGAMEDLLLAPLNPLLRAEADFVEARIAMHRHDFAKAAVALTKNASHRLWPEPNAYWRAVCLASSGMLDAAASLFEQICETSDDHAAAAAQLAVLSAQREDFAAAETWQSRAADRDAEHPFVVLVQGQLAEHRGEQDSAVQCFARLAAADELVVGRRIQAAAHLALGRIAQLAGHLDDAVSHFRKAHRCCPENAVGIRRLGLILAIHSQTDEDWREADQELEAAEQVAPADPHIALGRICTAEAQGQTDILAERLARLLNLPEFSRFPATVQNDLALLSADTQLRRKEYGAAADALQTLLKRQPEEKFETRLRKCRLLQALQLVGLRPIPDGALEKIRMASEAVCTGTSPPAHAFLLKIIAGRLLGELDDEIKRSACLAEIEALDNLDGGLEEIAWTTRLWLGDDSISEQLTERLSTGERAKLRRCVELIAASLNRDSQRFRVEMEKLMKEEESIEGVPFDPNEIVVVGVLTGGETEAERTRSCNFLERWHSKGFGNEQTRTLQSHLLAHRGVKELKLRHFGSSRQLLQQAIDAMADMH